LTFHDAKIDIIYQLTSMGMRQDFVLKEKPAGEGDISLQLAFSSAQIEFSCNGSTLTGSLNEIPVYAYTALKVWDANNAPLAASMQWHEGVLSLILNDDNAVYPITIDPVSITPNAILTGNMLSSQYGNDIDNAGDVNGDGYDDLIVGSIFYSNGQSSEGAAYIYLGSASGISTTPQIILESNQNSANFGKAVAGAGDINNDGYDDIVIGAYNYDNGQTNEGRAYIYMGSASGISATPALTLEVNQAQCNFGSSVAAAGDVNNDGFADVIIGAYNYDNGQTNEGRAYVYHGSATGLNATPVSIMESNSAQAYFGWSVGGDMDVNGDGFDDVIVGAYNQSNGQANEGLAYVFHGSASGIITTPAATREMNQVNAFFGESVSNAGDVNNDGYDDVIIGAYLFDNGMSTEGAAFIYHGSPTGISAAPITQLEANIMFAYFGYSVDAAGDINGDGFDDVIVGAYIFEYDQQDEGRAFVFPGSVTGVSDVPDAVMERNEINANFGYAVCGGGDFNNDGFSDVAVSAPKKDFAVTDAGGVFVYHGSNCTPHLLFEDFDGDGYGAFNYPIVSCDATAAGYAVNNDDCVDDNAAQNPTTVWHLDADGDGYYIDDPAGITQCESPGTGYAFAGILGGDDCDDANPAANPGATEMVNGVDDNCDGIIEPWAWEGAVTLEGNQTSAYFGSAVSSAGDVNNDGYDDIIVAANGWTDVQSDEGAIFIYHGSATGVSPTPNTSIQSNYAFAYFGYSVAAAGDVNGDGYDDIIVGATNYELGQSNEGAAFIYHGSATGINTTPATILQADQADAFFGYDVAGNADLNNDGYDDVIVSAYMFDNGQTNEGRVFIYYGSPSGVNSTPVLTLESDQPNAYFGRSIAINGDVNNDGYEDLVIGASHYDNILSGEGRVFVYLGTAAGIDPLQVSYHESNQTLAYLGRSVAMSDVNGDGYDDVIAGAHYYDDTEINEGAIFVFNGSASGVSTTADDIIETNQGDAFLGISLASLDDINNDGYDDIITGATGFDGAEEDQGKAFQFNGSASGLSPSPEAGVFERAQYKADYGVAVANAGDVNGDGINDILIGADKYDAPSSDEGIAMLFLSCSTQFFADADGDGYGDDATLVNSCNAPLGYVSIGGDCDDDNASVHPGATEICNGIDDNCNGNIDEGFELSITIAALGATTFCEPGTVTLSASYTGTSIQWKRNGTNIAGATSATYTANQSGTYRAETSNACGSDLSEGIVVTVNKKPTATITASGATTFCAGGSVTLNVTPVAGCSYQWYNGATAIGGATGTAYVATTAGSYKCRVTKTATGCYKNSNIIDVTVPCKESLNSELGFSVFPNPANEQLNVTVSEEIDGVVHITDLAGNIVIATEMHTGNMAIDISILPAGMYMLFILQESKQLETKFIKQ
ncbi:MAG TPA: FG-GAP-like repeat-containing protein, partial [Chitinophagales bacterium]|nr:FG-GAP-like repeat-containing protein [Chitinophagales bacterium]